MGGFGPPFFMENSERTQRGEFETPPHEPHMPDFLGSREKNLYSMGIFASCGACGVTC